MKKMLLERVCEIFNPENLENTSDVSNVISKYI